MALRKNISITDLYLDPQNPRQKTNSQEEAIEWLCENEKIDNLAEDIVENGLNPLELTGVLEADNNIWFALEGNRRICALKLLIEPELAPNAKLKRKFQQLKAEWNNPVYSVECTCFSSREEADIWLDRLHQGEQDGLGRSQWNAIQKQRRGNKPENKRALMILDYALQKGWVNQDEITNKLTTATRYLNNEKFRTSLGVGNDLDRLMHSRPIDVFDSVVKRFINDLIGSAVDGYVSSRANKNKIEEYADSLISTVEDLTTHQDKPVEFNSTNSQPKETKKPRPKKPSSPPKLSINHNVELARALETHGNTKLKHLYYSLCMLDLNSDTFVPLATVGVWSFIESLTRDLGRNDNTSFDTFGSAQLRAADHLDRKSINTALTELVKQGNMTKHSANYALFSREAIASIMETLTPFLLYLLRNNTVQKIAGQT